MVSYKVLDQKVRDLWQLEVSHKLIDLTEGYYIVRFFSRNIYLHVLEGGPWIVLGHYLTVSKWKPMFRPSAESNTTTLVWVRFMAILSELLDEEILSTMGDMLGKTDRVDSMSLTGLRAKFMRVCVEIDLSAPLLPSHAVFYFAQALEYEGLNLICFGCEKYGHNVEECPALNAPATNLQPVPKAPPEVISEPDPSTPKYGPWMLPSYARKRQQSRPSKTR